MRHVIALILGLLLSLLPGAASSDPPEPTMIIIVVGDTEADDARVMRQIDELNFQLDELRRMDYEDDPELDPDGEMWDPDLDGRHPELYEEGLDDEPPGC